MLAHLIGLEGKDADSLRKATTRTQDEIKKIREFINGKTSDKQGITRSPFEVTPMTQLQQAQQFIFSKMVAPGPQAEVLVGNAEKGVGEAVSRINTFFSGAWAAYRQQVEGTRLNLFKEYKPIE